MIKFTGSIPLSNGTFTAPTGLIHLHVTSTAYKGKEVVAQLASISDNCFMLIENIANFNFSHAEWPTFTNGEPLVIIELLKLHPTVRFVHIPLKNLDTPYKMGN